MELGWIIIMTLKLTRANLLRIKNTLVQFINTNPLLSAFIFVVVAVIILIVLIKYTKSTA
jgi:heme/copper-type cytochrome/quinol oxidase subunit 2